ncbi:MAG TPA: DUF1501 domain-containing protein [Candidatus Saccharimonadales bacterium]|nr:DUF1501 domain-containing protein [Candidatus Saccharimonadales bacterium]
MSGAPHQRRGQMTRRAMLRIGAIAPLGLTLPTLLKAATNAGPNAGRFGQAKRCLMLYMWGGPSHIDTFDMKPGAPAEIRGDFSPISTNIPGIQICEHLPFLAKHADKLGFVRSVTHSDNNHSTSAHWMLTGRKHALSAENFSAEQSDFPHIGSVLSKLAPVAGHLPTFVALPEIIATTAGFVTPGQGGGILGRTYDPFRINQHPDEAEFRVQNLTPVQGLSDERLRGRVSMLQEFEHFRGSLITSAEARSLSVFQERALDLVTSSETRNAFDLEAEGAAQRDRYGRHTFGQSLLLARRMMEAGVKLVTVYWHRDKPGVDTTWDTHSGNFKQLKERLLPQVDRPISALLDDLAERGMLEDTLVVWMSEFGRTPKVNNNEAGRDHWGACNTIWMAGGGVPGGQVYGASDKIASEPVSDAVSPADLSATIYHLLGLDPASLIYDQLGRPLPISEGQVMKKFIGA